MKIRILSDLHLDANTFHPLRLSKEHKNVFTVIAGDVGGDLMEATDWIHNHCETGVFVAGNHLVYNRYHQSIQELKSLLKEDFPKGNGMVFLDNDYVEKDNLIIVGTTLYTDFKLNAPSQSVGMETVEQKLNDFWWGLYRNNDRNEKLKAEHYVQMFHQSLAYIDKICQENPTKQIIVVTHHAPSEKSISQDYVPKELSCAYASDLDQFILNRPNIKCWIHGHVHHQSNYKIGNCLVVSNPRGYIRGSQENSKKFANCFLDTDTWSVSIEPLTLKPLVPPKVVLLKQHNRG